MVEFDSLWVHYYCPLAQLVERATVNRLVPGSSPGRTVKNVMLVVQWWWNHLKNLRCIEESGLPRLFWEQEIAGSNPAAPI